MDFKFLLSDTEMSNGCFKIHEPKSNLCLQGLDGDNGKDGVPGAAGLPGADVSETTCWE